MAIRGRILVAAHSGSSIARSDWDTHASGTSLPVSPDRTNRTPTRRPRIGLVLGAGGLSGAAFHAGTLLALEQDLGWDPRSASIIVGSSAGGVVGMLLRSGLSTDDLAAWATSAPAHAGGLAARELIDDIGITPYRFRRPQIGLRAWSWSRLGRALRPGGVPAHAALLSMLPDGLIDISDSMARLGGLSPRWPDEPLWIPAVRKKDSARVVFGRDDVDVSVGQAIAATSAVPLLFRPVTIGADRFIDGATHSPTNADLLGTAALDVAVILSPMSGKRSDLTLPRPDHLLRLRYHHRLEIERRALTDAGIEVHVLEPRAATLKSMGINALDRGRTTAVVRDSFLEAGGQIATDVALRDALRSPLRRAATHGRSGAEESRSLHR